MNLLGVCSYEHISWTKLPSGKLLHNELENYHAINGKINDFDWAMFNSYVSVYQAG